MSKMTNILPISIFIIHSQKTKLIELIDLVLHVINGFFFFFLANAFDVPLTYICTTLWPMCIRHTSYALFGYTDALCESLCVPVRYTWCSVFKLQRLFFFSCSRVNQNNPIKPIKVRGRCCPVFCFFFRLFAGWFSFLLEFNCQTYYELSWVFYRNFGKSELLLSIQNRFFYDYFVFLSCYNVFQFFF